MQGTIPFMSCRLLAQLSDAQKVASGGKKMTYVPKTTSNTMELPVTQVVQSFSDDLESLFFMFIWICIKFCGPHGQVREDLGNSIPDRWNNMDLESCAAFKGNFVASMKEEQRLVDEIHPYFKDLIPLGQHREKLASFNNILTLLNSHLDCLPDDEELSMNMLRSVLLHNPSPRNYSSDGSLMTTQTFSTHTGFIIHAWHTLSYLMY
jgi:hypothetical protein